MRTIDYSAAEAESLQRYQSVLDGECAAVDSVFKDEPAPLLDPTISQFIYRFTARQRWVSHKGKGARP